MRLQGLLMTLKFLLASGSGSSEKEFYTQSMTMLFGRIDEDMKSEAFDGYLNQAVAVATCL